MAKIKFNPKKFFHQTVVIDASVLIKSFLKESGYEIVDKLLEMHWKKELTLMATPLLLFEFLNVISRSVKNYETAKNLFERFNNLNIPKLDLEDKFVFDAISKVFENKKISYYDASYHALAKDFDGTFLTADKKYYELMKNKGNVALFD